MHNIHLRIPKSEAFEASYIYWYEFPFHMVQSATLRENCPYSEFLWSVFSRIRTEYGEILGVSSYSVQMLENTDQKKLRIGTLSCSSNTEFM